MIIDMTQTKIEREMESKQPVSLGWVGPFNLHFETDNLIERLASLPSIVDELIKQGFGQEVRSMCVEENLK